MYIEYHLVARRPLMVRLCCDRNVLTMNGDPPDDVNGILMKTTVPMTISSWKSDDTLISYFRRTNDPMHYSTTMCAATAAILVSRVGA